jgi:hypothetical protein
LIAGVFTREGLTKRERLEATSMHARSGRLAVVRAGAELAPALERRSERV